MDEYRVLGMETEHDLEYHLRAERRFHFSAFERFDFLCYQFEYAGLSILLHT